MNRMTRGASVVSPIIIASSGMPMVLFSRDTMNISNRLTAADSTYSQNRVYDI